MSISSWHLILRSQPSHFVTRETAPEAIDKLQRRKLELEAEIHALVDTVSDVDS